MTGSGRASERHAVVVGAGIGGLLAARVLGETFDRVTVLDRDALPGEGVPRRSVPQGHHAHGLLSQGREILDELFPGLHDDLVAAGAVPCDIQRDVRWYNDGLLLRPAPSRLRGLSVSRPLLERHLRSRVEALPGVVIQDRREVVEPVAGRPGAVTGVRVALPGRPGEVEEIEADLVVNATGRGNRGAEWLRRLGYEPAAEERVDSRLAYVSREYRRRPGDADVVAMIVGHSTAVPRGGVALSGEGDRWLVTLYGMGDDIPPTDPDGYHRFAARVPVPDLHRLLERLEPLGEPRLMRIPVSVRRRYERLSRFPEGYLVFGDALCQFNPTYGQGMTVAACEAVALRECLAAPGGRGGLARRFHGRAARIIDVAWDISVGGDLRFPSVEGPRPLRLKLLNNYIARLHVAAEADPVVGHAFLSVANLQAPPRRLLSPGVLARVLRPRPGRARHKTPARDRVPAGH
ncbi:FAD-binding monooxygenase [Sphaerisporangium krabiense]|uniref:2-polyprenyl-6-methoxyphenol hydroxylase-like FAD-dependent oxidoreductase n=1 Tax=Sphaerisporangium krabiense TaxID=763782 RepID=A0A7W9DMY7_9ACTN|nr:FAD-dependent monooxygenase [Sphaerisporangium krabiense]MBB5624817.1 2-polyprenyl-6-methoxyphenol hydroxylase-like FAD-dependent oxidoreductase [Sphaerisporangium krabiense]GII66483.1 FAD-binding monooxygenase [Sphaerisporangium krabiense]